MNLAQADQIAKAVLYEGYMLYPYRPSSVKNQHRWNFGVVYPQAYCDAQGGGESSSMRTECLISTNSSPRLEVRLRFLHLRMRASEPDPSAQSALPDNWQEAVERDFSIPALDLEQVLREPQVHTFSFLADTSEQRRDAAADVLSREEVVEGAVEVTAGRVRPDVLKISILVRNTTVMNAPAPNRDRVLLQSLVSTHLVLGVENGEFISLLEPPEELKEVASHCQNVGVWPVLVGEAGQRDTMLASPIILYDYPQIAPESSGDLFDGTEIDEILSLRIMTLTDEEKREIRASDERTRQILERTEAMPAEQLMKLHGAVRGMRPPREHEP